MRIKKIGKTKEINAGDRSQFLWFTKSALKTVLGLFELRREVTLTVHSCWEFEGKIYLDLNLLNGRAK